MPVRSGRLPVSGLEYAELCREAESSQSLVSRVVRVTVSLAHYCDTLTTVPRTSLAIHVYFFFFENTALHLPFLVNSLLSRVCCHSA